MLNQHYLDLVGLPRSLIRIVIVSSVSLYLCLFPLSLYLSISLSLYLSISLSLYLSISLSLYLSISPKPYLI